MANTSTIQIVLNTTAAQQNANQLNNSVNNIGTSAASTGFALNKLAAAIGTVFAVDKLKQNADAYTSIQNQIRRTTENQNQLNASTEALLRLSNETRTGLADTTDLYTSLAVSTQNLGYSQEQVFGLTKTINNLFLESGKSAEESAGAIRQLGQALQSGALRGDEFNSIAEGAPGILRAIREETGKTAGELRKFAETGGITAGLITRSLENYSEKAQEAADKTKFTLAQSFTVASNNATVFVGRVNEANGASSSLAKVIIDLSESLASQDNIDNFILFFKQASKSIGESIGEASGTLSQFSNELELFGEVGSESVGLIGRSFRDLAPNIKASVQIIVVEVASFIDKVSAKFKQFDDYLSNFLDGDNAEKSLANYENKINAINSARDESIQQIFRERDAIIESSKAEIKARNDAAAAGGGTNSNFGNKGSASAPVETADQLKARKKNEQARIDLIKQVEAEIEAEGERMDIADREIAGAQSVTAQLKIELDKRKQISEIYREEALNSENDIFARQRAAQQARQFEEIANVQAKAALDAQRREEQFRLAMENENLTESEKLRIKNEYRLQEQLQSQINQEQLTAIEAEGTRARIELARAERDSKIDLYSNLANTGLQIISTFGKKSFQSQKNIAIAEGAVAIAGGVAKALNNPYPANLGFAAQVALQGAKLLQTIKSANPGSGGAVSGIGGGQAGTGGGLPTTASTQESTVQQKRIYDLRGVKADDKISISAMAALLEDDGAVVMIENAREDAARRNVIGVTAR